jgi:hypothetical protein
MESRTFKAKQPIPFAEFAADVARRQAEFGPVEAPRNAGLRRTESKRALLKAIEELGGKW